LKSVAQAFIEIVKASELDFNEVVANSRQELAKEAAEANGDAL
jgi:hypothetical protein